MNNMNCYLGLKVLSLVIKSICLVSKNKIDYFCMINWRNTEQTILNT